MQRNTMEKEIYIYCARSYRCELIVQYLIWKRNFRIALCNSKIDFGLK